MFKHNKNVAKMVLAAFLFSLVLPGSLFAAPAANVSDTSGHWAEATIQQWLEDGLIAGYQDGTFQPDKAITRAEFIKLLNKAIDAHMVGAVSFTDVSANDWFYGELQLAMGAGYVAGFEDGSFRPSDTLTRAQAAAFIAKAEKLADAAQAADTFTDSSAIAAWAKGAVGAAAQAGIVGGYADGSFGPERALTRAEAVAMLDRVRHAGQEAALTITEDKTVISNQTIDGDVVIAASVGSGQVTLDKVTITGDLLIKGGGAHSVYLQDTVVKGTVAVDKSGVRVVWQGDSSAGKVALDVPATLDAQSFNGELAAVTVSPSVSSGQTVTIKVPVNQLNLESKATVQIQSAVGTVNANAAAKITGSGKIDTLNANVSGVTTQIKAATVHTATGVSAPSVVSTSGGGSSSGGSSGGSSTVAVSGITLSPSTATVAVGGSTALSATVTPDNASDKTVTWSSSNTSVATVKGGTVTGVSAGRATITAKAGEKMAQCTVTVTAQPSGTDISNDQLEYSAATGALTIKANGTINAESLGGKNTVATLTVAQTVDEAVIDGITVTGATSINGGGSESVHFTGCTLRGTMTLNKENVHVALEDGSSTQEIVIAKPAALSVASDAAIEAAVTVQNNLEVRAGVLPEVTVKAAATLSGAGAVKEATVATTGDVTLQVPAETVSITEAATVALEKPVTVVEVKEAATVQVKADVETLTVKSDAAEGQATINVNNNVTVQEVTAESAAAVTGTGTVGTAIVTTAKLVSIAAPTTTVEVETSGAQVAITAAVTTVNVDQQANITVGASGSVTTVISASENETDKVVVKAENGGSVTTIIAPSADAVDKTSAGQVTVVTDAQTISYVMSDGTPADAAGQVSVSGPKAAVAGTVNFTVAPKSGYTVSSVTAQDASRKTITVTDSAPKYSFTMPDAGAVTVTITTAAAPTGVSVAPTALKLMAGEERTITATVAPAGVAQSVTWSSSNEAVATVADGGVVTAVTVGSATITATTANGKTATCALTVVPKTTDTTKLIIAPLHDTTEGKGQIADADLFTKDTYKVTVDKTTTPITLKIAVKDLQKHQNGTNTMGYWVGVALPVPEGIDLSKTAASYYFGDKAADGVTSGTITESDKLEGENYVTFYANVDDPATAKVYINIDWDGDEKVYGIEKFKLDVSQVTKKVPTTVLSDIIVAPLHDTRAEGAGQIADADLFTGDTYKVTVDEKATPVALKIAAEGLQKHQNGANTMGYWVGVALPVAKDITLSADASASYYFGAEANEGVTSGTITAADELEGENYVTFYANVDDPATAKVYINIDWDGEGKVYGVEKFKLDVSQVMKKVPTTVLNDIIVAPLHDTRAEGQIADDQLFTKGTYAVTVDETETPIALKIAATDLVRHQNGADTMGYWVGVALPVPEGIDLGETPASYYFGDKADDGVVEGKTITAADELEGENYVTFYANVDDPNTAKVYINIDWDGEGKVYGVEKFKIDVTGVKLAGEVIAGVESDEEEAVS